jgi:hypothetical protein
MQILFISPFQARLRKRMSQVDLRTDALSGFRHNFLLRIASTTSSSEKESRKIEKSNSKEKSEESGTLEWTNGQEGHGGEMAPS